MTHNVRKALMSSVDNLVTTQLLSTHPARQMRLIEKITLHSRSSRLNADSSVTCNLCFCLAVAICSLLALMRQSQPPIFLSHVINTLDDGCIWLPSILITGLHCLLAFQQRTRTLNAIKSPHYSPLFQKTLKMNAGITI